MKNKKSVLVNSLLGIAIVSLVSFSFAWFINNSDVSIVNRENFEIQVGSDLAVSVLKSRREVEGELVEEWTDYGALAMLEAPKLRDVTSNGITFFSPYALVNVDDEKEGFTRLDTAYFPMYEIPSEKHTNDYIEVEIKIKTSTSCSIYLADGSYVAPVNTSFTDSNKSTYGDFSVDYIAGAARVAAFAVPEDGEELKEDKVQIWIPNDKYQLEFAKNGSGVSFLENGIREIEYGYCVNCNDEHGNPSGKFVQYTPKDFYSKRVVLGNNLANSESSLTNGARPIVSFANNGEEQEQRIILRIWIEGTDREANVALNLGKCKYRIVLCAINKANPSPEDEEFLESITLDKTFRKLYSGDNEITAENNVYYSPNGIDWFKYTGEISLTYDGIIRDPNNLYNLKVSSVSIDKFYLKLGETVLQEHKTVREFTFAEEPEVNNED